METAIQEDADAIGLSVLSGAHMTLFRRVVELLAERGVADIVVFGGGIIPEEDFPELQRLGVAKIFTPGATTSPSWSGSGRTSARPSPSRKPGTAQSEEAGRTPHTPGPSMHDAPPPPLDRQGIGRLMLSRPVFRRRHHTQRRQFGPVTPARSAILADG